MSEPMVTFEIKMTPQEYVRIQKDASWFGKTVAEYLVAYATGNLPRGC